MIPQANITAWRAHAPWADDAQVEQDLVLTRAVIELFSEPKLKGQIALEAARHSRSCSSNPRAAIPKQISHAGPR